MNQIKAKNARQVQKYEYPMHVLTAAMLQRYAHYGVNFSVRRSDCTVIGALDSQRERKKTIFGGGLLLSERAAAERAAAERAAAERAAAHIWSLSDRELQIIRELGKDGDAV